ncbi:transglutaminase domain protein [Teredinibacter turnerae T7901]|uniref:Transglutaminase domain protein n=1 Tax=Teredinibacter turnerae (strain ATCC 39867 / T7901) TaxID=377629 RepID=C5BL47_TERTT|nr:DUF3488 and transglutaminase-like domain-containing protein [Teredinibacter turnerae]ACR11249.1 transglutaminase domain protein [Teredinibacter turnerae T7901]
MNAAPSSAQAGAGETGIRAGSFAREHVSRQTLWWMFVAQGAAILPLFLYLPKWLVVYWLCAVVIRLQVHRGVWPFPGSSSKAVFGVGGMIGLVLSFSSIGVEPMIGLLVLAFVLKLVEVRTRSSVLLVLYIGFVTAATQLLLAQGFFQSVYTLLCCVLLIAALQSLHRQREVSFLEQLRAAFNLLLQSLPVMLVLFLVMPRLGQLWAVPTLSGTGTTGFSESMSPGELSGLVSSHDIVFRASFESGRMPAPVDRYWRGLVLDKFDGSTWSRRGAPWQRVTQGATKASRPHPESEIRLADGSEFNGSRLAEVDTYNYSILLEPHQYSWLFGLMVPVWADASNTEVLFSENYNIISNLPIFSRVKYQVRSLPVYTVNASGLTPFEQRMNLLLPVKVNPRARELAQQWRDAGLGPEAMIEQALAFYRANLTYTLRPPVLDDNTVDRFLFDSQRGFCEHFASSFVFLMRAAGIPARVVVGYQGGEYRAEGDYLVVRQSDAHAWAEVWLAGKGWRRVDPTAAVAPERIESSLLDALSSDESSLVGGALLRLRGMAMVALLQAKMEEWDYLWQMRVMGYDSANQAGFLSRLLGGTDPWRVGLFFSGTIGGLLALYYLLSIWVFKRVRRAPHDQLIVRALEKMARSGCERLTGETLTQYSHRVAMQLPSLSEPWQKVATIYCAIAYRGQTVRLDELRRAVKAL